MAEKPDVTVLLGRVQKGDGEAANQLFPLIYDELKRRAQSYMSKERHNHTLQATALVHEVYVKLVGGQALAFQSREHFFNAAAQAMRRLLVDHARSRATERRGGGAGRVELDQVDAVSEDADWLSLDVAMEKLQKENPRMHQVVMYRFFAGLSVEEIAELLGVNAKTVQRDWKAARMFLSAEMDG